MWGPPQSAVKRWIARSIDYNEEGVRAVAIVQSGLLPPIRQILAQAELSIAAAEQIKNRQTQIFIEWPWSLVDEDMDLEEWIATQPALHAGGWNVSFLGICPDDVHRLPRNYREQMEEFARASNSSVIVAQSPDSDLIPLWLDKKEILDFGRRVEVLAEKLWVEEEVVAELTPLGDTPDFVEMKADIEELCLPVSIAPVRYRPQILELWNKDNGDIWGAELYWTATDPESKQEEFQCINVGQGKIFQWSSDNPSLIQFAKDSGPKVFVAGVDLHLARITKLFT